MEIPKNRRRGRESGVRACVESGGSGAGGSWLTGGMPWMAARRGLGVCGTHIRRGGGYPEPVHGGSRSYPQ